MVNDSALIDSKPFSTLSGAAENLPFSFAMLLVSMLLFSFAVSLKNHSFLKILSAAMLSLFAYFASKEVAVIFNLLLM